MLRQKPCQGQIGQDVSVIEEEGGVAQSTSGIPDAAARIEKKRLMKDMQGPLAIGRVRTKNFREGFGEMVRVDGQRPDSGGNQAIERKAQQRLMKDRHQWLGKRIGQGTQPGPETRSKNERSRTIH